MGLLRYYINSTEQNDIRMRIEGVQRIETEYNAVVQFSYQLKVSL
jgi:hypothetical protein